MTKIKYMLVESVRRLMQIAVSPEIFEFPGLRVVRCFAYRCCFKMGKGAIIGRQVRLYRQHGLTGAEIIMGDHVLLANHVEIDYSGGVVLDHDLEKA